MRPYEAYKPSGIEWIGDIPKHWKKKKIKFFSDIILGKMLTNKDGGGFYYKNYLRAQNINWFNVDISDVKKMWFSEDELKKYRLEEKDILITEGGEVGRACIWKEELEECYIQNSVYRVKCHEEYDQDFFLFQCFMLGISGYFESIVNKISIAHLTKEKLKEVYFVFPGFEEQKQISNFLRKKTQQIDDLISKKRRLIQLLEEEKAAVINRAVTKGLDPDVPMRESGIPWLGKIPAHWKIIKIKHLCKKITDGEHISPKFQSDGVPFLSAKDVRDRHLNFDVNKFVSESEAQKLRRRCNPEKGDLLIVSRGATIGRIALVESSQVFCLLGSVILLKPDLKVNSNFLYYALNSSKIQENFLLTSGSSAQQAIYLVNVADLMLPFPLHAAEQASIVKHLDEEFTRIFTFINKIDKEIELLLEYRIALINEAVTGKIDVREEEGNR